jgi:hypothetical protein
VESFSPRSPYTIVPPILSSLTRRGEKALSIKCIFCTSTSSSPYFFQALMVLMISYNTIFLLPSIGKSSNKRSKIRPSNRPSCPTRPSTLTPPSRPRHQKVIKRPTSRRPLLELKILYILAILDSHEISSWSPGRRFLKAPR